MVNYRHQLAVAVPEAQARQYVKLHVIPASWHVQQPSDTKTDLGFNFGRQAHVLTSWRRRLGLVGPRTT